MNDWDRAASAFIRASAGAQKLSMYDLAETAGIHISTFRPYWRGDRSISLGDFVTILGVLHIEGEDAMKDIKRLIATGNYTA